VFLISAGRYSASLGALERATDLARAGGDKRTLVRAAWNRADILQRLGRLGEALRVYREVLPLAEALADQEALLSVHRDLAYIHVLQGDFEIGRRHGDQALALAEQLENPPNRSVTLALRGWIAGLAGDWQCAPADLDEALALSRQLEPSWYSPYVLTFRARLALAEGDWADAAASVREAIALAEGSGDLQVLRWASTTMAESEILEDRPEAARARLMPLLDRPGLEECDVTTLLPVLAWAQLELGQVEQAASTLEEALARAQPEGMRLVVVETLRVQALLALRRGQSDMAAFSLEEGLELARAMPYPYAEARLLHVAGALHAEQGAPELARERWEEALARFTRLGALTDVARTAQALRTLPGSPLVVAAEHRVMPVPEQPARVAAVAEARRLTRAERQVWALTRLRAGGELSPRGYAAALGVSVDTALRDLRDLAERGEITALGTTKDRRYVLRRAATQVRR
jgi:tetratricopeptide (TPR) repeat protein